MKSPHLAITHGICILLALSCAAPAHADGGSCPPGYYPVGGGASIGCAPMPLGSSQQRSGPRVYREDRYGAVAMSPAQDRYGAAKDLTSARRARNAALKDCGEDCTLTFEFKNTCVALVKGPGNVVTYDKGSNEVDAMYKSVEKCMLQTKQECQVVYAGCSKAVLSN